MFLLDVVDLLRAMFPDCKIAERMQLGLKELKCVVNYGIAPYAKDLLTSRVISTGWFVVPFDESLNDVAQKCEMGICIRFWNKETSQVEDQYWDSKFLGHTAHRKLLVSLQESLKDFDMIKMVQLSIDGPNVNLKLLKVMKEQRTELSFPGLIDFGSCTLRALNGAFESGTEASGLKLKKMLKSCFEIFSNSPARCDDY